MDTTQRRQSDLPLSIRWLAWWLPGAKTRRQRVARQRRDNAVERRRCQGLQRCKLHGRAATWCVREVALALKGRIDCKGAEPRAGGGRRGE